MSLELLMVNPAGAGMTGIKFGQKGPLPLPRALSWPEFVIAVQSQQFQVPVTDREDAVDSGWKYRNA
jgi:hypothetical protein